MVNAHIDISQGLDGEPVVLACFDLGEELLAVSDELADLALRPGMRTVVLRPARLTVYRDAIARFVESRDESDWVREEDREPLARVRSLLHPLEDLCADALRAALSGGAASRPC